MIANALVQHRHWYVGKGSCHCCPLRLWFSPPQSAAGRWGSVHPPHYSGQLYCASSTGGGAHGGGSICPYSRHGCCCSACTGRRSSCGYCCCLCRIPASPRCHGLRVCTETAGGSPTTTSCHLTKLPGKRRERTCFLYLVLVAYTSSLLPARLKKKSIKGVVDYDFPFFFFFFTLVGVQRCC